jgi:hypothetical protein
MAQEAEAQGQQPYRGLHELREVGKRLKDELPPELLANCRNMLIEGVASYQVADAIHKAGFMLDDEIPELSKQLRRWANREIPLHERVLIHKPLSVKRAILRFEGATEELEQLCDLLHIQRERLQKAQATEDALGVGAFMPLRGIDEIVDNTRKIVESIVKTKVAMGFLDGSSQRPMSGAQPLSDISLDAEAMGRLIPFNDPAVARTMSDPTKRARVLSVVRRVLEAGEVPPPVAPTEQTSVTVEAPTL